MVVDIFGPSDCIHGLSPKSQRAASWLNVAQAPSSASRDIEDEHRGRILFSSRHFWKDSRRGPAVLSGCFENCSDTSKILADASDLSEDRFALFVPII
jgi:hypothetical protein